LVGNKAKRCVREDLPGPQQAARVTESAELQRKAELIGVAAVALYGGEIGGTQGPVLDQFGFAGRQGKQHLELLAGNGAASRHGELSQIELRSWGSRPCV
jgi:hypothetical protein